ncbi:HNH endonuclease, partial [Citrobacter freundii]|nr:HNH endonuclease [Citrobacter freundii]
IYPKSFGGESIEENLILVCPNCHFKLDQAILNEREFITALVDLLKNSHKYKNIETNKQLGNQIKIEVDIYAELTETREEKKEIIVECKSLRAISEFYIDKVIDELETINSIYPSAKIIFATPSRIPEKIKEVLVRHDVFAWDIDYILNEFSDEIGKSNNPYLNLLIGSVGQSKSNLKIRNLSDRLKKCSPGKKEWSIYQKLIGEILAEIFCPPLQSPMPENSDYLKTNRRDFILSNYAKDGFWEFLRSNYKADYIVVDAKNYSNKIKKDEVLQIANYLKPHGAGMFGMIFTRKGGDSRGCETTLREQWILHGKLILVFDDEDVENMLVASSTGTTTDIIGQKIEKFRLSM